MIFGKLFVPLHPLICFQAMIETVIPLNGWAAGEREFRYHADTEFFQQFDNAEILDADVDVLVKVLKSGRRIDVDLFLDGRVTVLCDRCLEEVDLGVEADPQFRVAFGKDAPASEKEEGEERETLFLDASEADLDLSQAIYDYVCLSLPARRVHPEGACNPDTVRFLSQEGKDEEAAQNSPFSALKGLFAE